jgi:hypothetical protein
MPASLDVKNVYVPAVMVSASVADVRKGGPLGNCSGVLIDSRIVVTAAHCFCRSRALAPQDELPPAKSRMPLGLTVLTRASALQDAIVTEITDKRSCAQRADVSTLVCEPPTVPGAPPTTRGADWAGRVFIHPDFEMIVVSKQGRKEIAWNNADVAVVLLDAPVLMDFRPVVLSDSEAKVGDALVMAGYGLGEDNSKKYGARQFGADRVTRLLNLETGSVVLVADSPAPEDKAVANADQGDSGGPAVRKDNPNILVGIISMGANTAGGAKVSMFTSVYPHVQWLSEFIRQVKSAPDAGVTVPDAGAGEAPRPPPGLR